MTWFNEIDPFCAQWCRNAFGDEVDERDIRDIKHPVNAVRQHYFAGLGGWEWALRLANWPQDREVWTGSCPCQPFSAAGKQQGLHDERDLWSPFFRLIAQRRPEWVFGEQVEAAIGWGWLDRICDDLGTCGYTVRAVVLPACSVGAPHIRQRLYWVAVAQRDRATGCSLNDSRRMESQSEQGRSAAGGLEQSQSDGWSEGWPQPERWGAEPRRDLGGLEHTTRVKTWRDVADSRERPKENPEVWQEGTDRGGRGPDIGGLGDADLAGRQGWRLRPEQRADQQSAWAASQPIYCADGRWRRVPLESSFQPLFDGGRFGNPRVDPQLSSRIGALKAAGNAIVIPLAAEFIKAVMDLVLNL